MLKRSRPPNALKHGAFSKTAILPGEDPQEFEELHFSLIGEWAPVGATEEDAVLSIAKGIWRKRRLQKILEAGIRSDMTTNPKHPTYDEAFALEIFYDTIEDNPDDSRAFVGLKDMTADHLRQKFPRQDFQTKLEWVRAMQEEITSVLLPRVERRFEPAPEVYLARYLNPVSTRILLVADTDMDARVDAMIDRAVKRLVQTKAMKQMLGTTSANTGSDQSKKLLAHKAEGSAKTVTKKQSGRRSDSTQAATGTQRADPPSS